MNLKQLEAFVSVAETGSFSKTAKELYLTQPTISAHISSLEKELNTRLLVRNTKEVHLSDRGRTLYDMSKKILAMQNEILAEFGVLDSEKGKKITIAASTIPAQYILPDILAGFIKQNPGERFEMIEGDNATIIEKVIDGTAEIGFIGSKDEGIHCKQVPFYRDKLIVLTPNSEHFYNLSETDFEARSFLEEPFIIRQVGSGTRKETERALSEIGIDINDMNIVASMSNQEAIMKAVSQGMGITVVSELAARSYIEEGKALGFRFPGDKAFRDLNILFAKEFKLSQPAHKLVKFVQKYFEQK